MNKINQQESVEDLRRPKRPWKKIFFISAVFALLIMGFFAYSTLLTLGKITSGSGSQKPRNPFSFLGKIKNTGLKGESDGRINILLLGIGGAGHPGGQLTDTIMVASIDVKQKKLALISVPRDLYVPIATQNFYAKINTAHSVGETNPKTGGGPEVSRKTLSEVLDLPIHYFVRLDFSGFVKMIDTLGGVTVNVDKAIYDPYFPAPNMRDYEPFQISPGAQKLDGKTALKYARSRETTSDFDRALRQQKILTAVKEKVFSSSTLANPVKLTEILKILGEHVRTDLTLFEIERLVDIFQELDTQNIVTRVFDSSAEGLLVSSSGPGDGYYLRPRSGNFKEIQQVVKNIFQTQNILDVKKENAKIEILNVTVTSGLASKLSEDLKKEGFLVINVANSDFSISQSVIYDYSEGQKKATVKSLSEKLGMQSLQKPRPKTSTADLAIVLGEDYAKKNPGN